VIRPPKRPLLIVENGSQAGFFRDAGGTMGDWFEKVSM
jgi:hypothetical protein